MEPTDDKPQCLGCFGLSSASIHAKIAKATPLAVCLENGDGVKPESGLFVCRYVGPFLHIFSPQQLLSLSQAASRCCIAWNDKGRGRFRKSR